MSKSTDKQVFNLIVRRRISAVKTLLLLAVCGFTLFAESCHATDSSYPFHCTGPATIRKVPHYWQNFLLESGWKCESQTDPSYRLEQWTSTWDTLTGTCESVDVKGIVGHQVIFLQENSCDLLEVKAAGGVTSHYHGHAVMTDLGFRITFDDEQHSPIEYINCGVNQLIRIDSEGTNLAVFKYDNLLNDGKSSRQNNRSAADSARLQALWWNQITSSKDANFLVQKLAGKPFESQSIISLLHTALEDALAGKSKPIIMVGAAKDEFNMSLLYNVFRTSAEKFIADFETEAKKPSHADAELYPGCHLKPLYESSGAEN